MNRLHIILISVLVFAVLSFKLTQPFWGHHEFNGVFYGQIARNYQGYGLIHTRGAQITDSYRLPAGEWSLHTHHPATYPILLSLIFDLFGDYEFVSRLVSIAASAIAVIFLAKLAGKIYTSPFSWLGAILIIFTPLFVYYGSMPVFEPLLFPIVTSSLYFFWQGRKKDNYLAIFSLCALAVLLDWPGIWLAVWLAIFEFFTARRKKMLAVLILSLAVPLTAVFAHQVLVTGSLSDLAAVGKFRLGVKNQPYTTVGWVRLLLSRSRAFIGLPILAASVLGAASAFVEKNRDRLLFLLTVFGLGISHILVFRNIFWYHDYMLYHLLPFLGLSAACFFNFSYRKFKVHGINVILFSLIALSTTILRKPFLKALIELAPHKDCVAMGLSLKSQKQKQTFILNREKAKECPPFIGYYGEKAFGVQVSE